MEGLIALARTFNYQAALAVAIWLDHTAAAAG
jgi:hypothetical protein